MPAPLPSITLARPQEAPPPRADRADPPRAKDSNPRFDKALRDELRGKHRSESADAHPPERPSREPAETREAGSAPAAGEQDQAQTATPSGAQTPESDAQTLPVTEWIDPQVVAGPVAVAAPADAPVDVPAVATSGETPAPLAEGPAGPTGASPALQPAPRRSESAGQAPAPGTERAAAPASQVPPGRMNADDARLTDPRADERAAPAPRSAASAVSARADREPSQGFNLQQEESGGRPALGRAMQVQAAVRLENATGQAAAAEATLSPRAAAGEPGSGATAGQLAVQPGSVPAAEPDDSQDVFSARVVRGIGAAVNQRGGVMTMRLEPPDLGHLRVHLTIARGVVTAQFQPSTAEAHALLDRSMASLRSALEGHGLTVDRLTVQLPPSPATAMRDHHADQQGQQERHNPDAGQGQSRGRGDGQPDSSRHRFSDPRESPRDGRAPREAGADQT